MSRTTAPRPRIRTCIRCNAEFDATATPETVWSWLEAGYEFFPECRDDQVEFNYDHAERAWHTVFTPGMRAINVTLASGEDVLTDGSPTRVDLEEVRAKAAEQAARLFAKL